VTKSDDRSGDARDAVDTVVQQWGRTRPDLDVSAMATLGRISRAQYLLHNSLQQLHRGFGIDPRSFDVLATLYRAGQPSLTPGELAKQTMVGNAAMTNRLDQMVKQGWITREVNEANRRELRIRLTEAGSAKLEEVLDAHIERQRDLLSALSPNDVSELSRILRLFLISQNDRATASLGT
jgi:DNA-binding MarR family transcriptional regulator